MNFVMGMITQAIFSVILFYIADAGDIELKLAVVLLWFIAWIAPGFYGSLTKNKEPSKEREAYQSFGQGFFVLPFIALIAYLFLTLIL